MFGIKISRDGKLIETAYYTFSADVYAEAEKLEAKGYKCEVFYA